MNIFDFVNSTRIIKELEEDLAALISIKSIAGEKDGVYPYGRECGRVLDTMLALGEKYGFRTENHEYHCGSVIFGDKEKEVGIVTHLDVVPAGTGWSGDPFVLKKVKNCYVGRGTKDDKGPALIGLYAMRYFKENNIRLPFSIRLILGCDEEVGSSDLEYFKSVRKAPWFSFTPDHKYPVCIGEKGIMTYTISLGRLSDSIKALSGGSVSNAVPETASATVVTDKMLAEADRISVTPADNGYVITAHGVTAHASTPESGVNAVALLAGYLLENGLVPADNKKAFEFLFETESEYLGKSFGINFSDDYFGYLTCVGGVLSVKDGVININYNVRFPMSRSFDEIFENVEKTVCARGFRVIFSNKGTEHSIGYFRSPESPEIAALTKAAREVLKTDCTPYTMGGGTYARALPHTVAFGAEIDEYKGLLGPGKGEAHDCDEYLTEEEFKKGIEIFVKSITGLAGI